MEGKNESIKQILERMEKRIFSQYKKILQTKQDGRKLKSQRLSTSFNRKINEFDWPIGRVSNVHKGRDGYVRTVEIKMPIKAHLLDDKAKPLTQYKYLTRGIQNISLLEAAEE